MYLLSPQDQLATTASNYEHQLSTMSDHLCELNDRLLKQSDELESRKRPTKARPVVVVSFLTEALYTHRGVVKMLTRCM